MTLSEKLRSFLDNKEMSTIFLEHHLQDLKAAHQQQLQQIELQHQNDLERRIQENLLLTANTGSARKTSGSQENPCSDGNNIKIRGGIYM